jgi:hypothetical protein
MRLYLWRWKLTTLLWQLKLETLALSLPLRGSRRGKGVFVKREVLGEMMGRKLRN